ncbi:MAG: hypothetical protein J6Y28_01225 [Acholeplasmatales bacterium]|nr:hypothetical protein [Acholeplasmatales bacterium]
MGNIMDEKPKKTKKAPRIKHKKLIILFTAILVVATVFIIKIFNTKKYALAEETQSFEIERPKTGTPLDYSGKDNAAICNWVIKHEGGFKTVTTGAAIAKVVGMSYKQDIKNTRIVTNDGCYIETISNSSLVKVHYEKYLKDDQVVIKNCKKDSYRTVTTEEFLSEYGWHPTEYQAYILNEETILEATIEQAGDNYKLTLNLDPVSSAPKKQIETKTTGGAKGYPGYKKAILTITLDSTWRTLEIATEEVYDINMPGIGSITCKGDMVEVFEYGDFEIPNKDEFKSHLGTTNNDSVDDDKDTISYLQEIFGPLIKGEMNDFDLTADILDTKLNGNLNLRLDNGISANVRLDDIFVKYDGAYVYVKLGNNKYKLEVNKLMKQFSGTNVQSSVNVDDLISQVNNAVIKKDGNNVTVTIDLNMMGMHAMAKINATLNSEEEYVFTDLYAVLTIANKDFIFTMKPSNAYSYPTVDSTYENITDMFYIVDEVKALIDKPVEIDLETTIKDVNIKVNAIYDNGLASGNIIINDKYEANIYYEKDNVYFVCNNLKFKFNINDIDKFSDTKIDLGEFKLNVRDILDTLKTLDIDMLGSKSFSIKANLDKFVKDFGTLELKVSKTDKLNVRIENYNLDLSVAQATSKVATKPELEYVDVADLKWVIDNVMDAINYEAYSFDLDLIYNDIKVNGNVYLDRDLNAKANINLDYKDYSFKDVKVIYKDKTIYVEYANLKFNLTVDDIKDVLAKFNVELDTNTNIDLDALIDEVYGSLNITNTEDSINILVNLLSVNSLLENVSVTLTKDNKLSINLKDINANLVLSKAEKEEITISNDYISYSEISFVIDEVLEALDYEAYNFTIDATYKDIKVNGNSYLDKDLNVLATINLTYKDYEFNGINLIYTNDVIYVEFKNLKFSLTVDDIKEVLAKFDVKLEDNNIDINSIINDLTSSLTLTAINNTLTVNANLSSVNSLLENVSIILDNNYSASINLKDISANIKLEEATKQEIIINNDYINYSEISFLIDDIKNVLDFEAYNFNINLEYKDLVVTGTIYLDKDLNVEANLNVTYLGMAFNDIVLMYQNGDIYLSYGLMSIKINKDDINDIIEKINTTFNLTISTDSLNTEFDVKQIINDVLNSLVLSVNDETVNVKLDLSSINSMLENINININKDFNLNVEFDTIKANITLTSANKKDLVMPEAVINKSKVMLLIEYAEQLREVVEKWRYHIGFELHVNNHDVYADVNIVTNKPNAGLALYGKLIIFNGKKQYYVEASIIQEMVSGVKKDIAYLKFSQTITNLNKTNPIKSTTSQYINFKIDFDELIELANYAVDKLGITDDTIKMAITYLGTIVNTDGNFDDLFNELKDKAKSIDLSMINDMIDLSKLYIDVDDNELTINLGENSENNVQILKVLRENGAIKGLNVKDFEINNDILNANFELLEDANITNANYSGCLNFTGISGLVKAALNNYSKGEIAFSGSATVKFLTGGVEINFDVKLDFDYEGKLRGAINLSVEKLGLGLLGSIIISHESTSQIYIQNNMIYISRKTNSTSTRKMTLSEFGKDALEQIIWLLDFTDTIADTIRNTEAKEIKIEEVLKSYSGSDNSYNVTLDGEKLVGSTLFGDISLGLKTTKINNEDYLSSASISTKIVSVVSVSADVTFNNNTISWSSFPSIETLNGYTEYKVN